MAATAACDGLILRLAYGIAGKVVRHPVYGLCEPRCGWRKGGIPTSLQWELLQPPNGGRPDGVGLPLTEVLQGSACMPGSC